jgi:hypothetical protein
MRDIVANNVYAIRDTKAMEKRAKRKRDRAMISVTRMQHAKRVDTHQCPNVFAIRDTKETDLLVQRIIHAKTVLLIPIANKVIVYARRVVTGGMVTNVLTRTNVHPTSITVTNMPRVPTKTRVSAASANRDIPETELVASRMRIRVINVTNMQTALIRTQEEPVCAKRDILVTEKVVQKMTADIVHLHIPQNPLIQPERMSQSMLS